MDVSTFVQLFVINRFLKFSKEHEAQLLTFAAENSVSETSLSKLLKSGLSWIKDTSFNHNQCVAIFEVFNFIMYKYTATYEDVISTKIDSNKYPFSNKVLNQSDIITLIFQYLRILDINNCSLVDIGFLYHSFHCNAIYYIHTNNDHLYSIDKLRTWQRFLNARKVEFNQFTVNQHHNYEAPDIFWLNFCLMKNLEEINIYFERNCGALLKLTKIVSQSSIANRLKVFASCVAISNNNTNTRESQDNSKPKTKRSKTDVEYYIRNYNDIETVTAAVVAGIDLLLLNCQDIRIRDSLFSIVISKKCHKLSLNCDCIINYNYKSSSDDQDDEDDEIKCDMSGIRDLSLKNTTFYRKENIYVNNNINDNFVDHGGDEELKLVTLDDEGIISMANQCVNIENFEIALVTSHNVLFWKTLQLNDIKKAKNKKKICLFS